MLVYTKFMELQHGTDSVSRSAVCIGEHDVTPS